LPKTGFIFERRGYCAAMLGEWRIGKKQWQSVAAAGLPFVVSAAALLGMSPAQADPGVPGIHEFAQCVQSAGVPPRQNAEDWWPIIKQVEWNLNNAEPPAQVAQRLTASGIKPNDAAAEVRCAMATVW
jgi:hypothetical protein